MHAGGFAHRWHVRLTTLVVLFVCLVVLLSKPVTFVRQWSILRLWVSSTQYLTLLPKPNIDKERADCFESRKYHFFRTASWWWLRPRPLERFMSDTEQGSDDVTLLLKNLSVWRWLSTSTDWASAVCSRTTIWLGRRWWIRTLSQVGHEMGLSRERVRQIEREALTRLREGSNLKDENGKR